MSSIASYDLVLISEYLKQFLERSFVSSDDDVHFDYGAFKSFSVAKDTNNISHYHPGNPDHRHYSGIDVFNSSEFKTMVRMFVQKKGYKKSYFCYTERLRV